MKKSLEAPTRGSAAGDPARSTFLMALFVERQSGNPRMKLLFAGAMSREPFCPLHGAIRVPSNHTTGAKVIQH